MENGSWGFGVFDATWEVTTAAMLEYVCRVLIRATE